MNLTFNQGKAVVKEGRKTLVTVYDRKVFFKGTKYENSFSKYPFSIETKVGTRECRTLEECLEVLSNPDYASYFSFSPKYYK